MLLSYRMQDSYAEMADRVRVSPACWLLLTHFKLDMNDTSDCTRSGSAALLIICMLVLYRPWLSSTAGHMHAC